MRDTVSTTVSVSKRQLTDLTRFAYLMCGDQQMASDLVQEAILRMSSRGSGGEIQDLEAYARTAIARILFGWRRRNLSQHNQLIARVEDVVPGFDDAVAERDAMWRALRALSKRQRAVLVLRHYRQFTDEDIASELGCSRSTVRSLARRGIERLRTDPHITQNAVYRKESKGEVRGSC